MEVVLAQEKLNEFEIAPDGNCPFTIRPGDGEYGFVVINTTLSDLHFTIPTAPRRLVKADFNAEKQQWILTIVPNDNNYKRYRITLNSDGFKQGEIDVLVKQKDSQCFDVNPKFSSALEKLARITVYDKDNKILVGAVVKSKTTGIVYGSTRYDGTLAINFDNKGETTNVIVSHPSYSDTKEITVQAGVHDYKVYFRSLLHESNNANVMWYIVPGLGQIELGNTTEGVVTILGEVALLGGGVGSYFASQKQLEIMRDVDVSLADFLTAKSNYKTLRIINVSCYIGAAVLYGVHLYRVYYLSKEAKGKRYAFLTPTIITTDEMMAFGFCLNLNF